MTVRVAKWLICIFLASLIGIHLNYVLTIQSWQRHANDCNQLCKNPKSILKPFLDIRNETFVNQRSLSFTKKVVQKW